MRLRRVYRRRNIVLTAGQEKLQATRDIYEMRADVLCTGAALRLAKSSDNLTAFDYLRVSNASRAEKRYDESFRPSPRARKPKPSRTVRPKPKKAS